MFRDVTSSIHAAIGYVVVGGWFVLMLWGGATALLRRDPSRWLWRLVGALQAALLVQLAAGLVLLAIGLRSVWLHYLYGSLFPAIVLVVAHVLARGVEAERDAVKVFAVAAFFVFGLTLRALTTGLGLP